MDRIHDRLAEIEHRWLSGEENPSDVGFLVNLSNRLIEKIGELEEERDNALEQAAQWRATARHPPKDPIDFEGAPPIPPVPDPPPMPPMYKRRKKR